MRFLQATIIAVLVTSPVELRAEEPFPLSDTDQCIACHLEEELMPEGIATQDAHLKAGLSCAGCHGGDPTTDDEEAAMSEEAGFVGVPDRTDISELCGKCHSNIAFMRTYQPRIATDQVAQYITSVHGQKLAAGDTKVAVCTSCHTSHAIMPASDTRSSVHPLRVPGTCNDCHGDADYMDGYPIGTRQYDDYAASVHGKALLENEDTGAPACNDCHGNHGAMPPGVTSVSQVCGHCHVNNAEYFSKSAMGEAFAAKGLIGCEECHGNHRVEKPHVDMVGTSDESVCMDCHEEGDAGYTAAAEIRTHLAELSTAYDAALVKQEHVQRIGMDDEEIVFLLQESNQSLIQARTLVHTFESERVGETTGEGAAKAKEALELGEELVRDYHVRRRGFGVATLFTTLLLLALFLKIRQLD